MQGGRLRIEGESVDTSKDDGSAAQGPDEVFDGAGNKIEVKKCLGEGVSVLFGPFRTLSEVVYHVSGRVPRGLEAFEVPK